MIVGVKDDGNEKDDRENENGEGGKGRVADIVVSLTS